MVGRKKREIYFHGQDDKQVVAFPSQAVHRAHCFAGSICLSSTVHLPSLTESM